MSFERVDIKYTPKDIGLDQFLEKNGVELAQSETEVAMAKLLNHARIIKEWQDRIDAIKYLQDNAAKLAGNPIYITTESDVARAVEVFGGKDGTIDFAMFKKCVDVVIEGYKQMALVSITGVM